MPGEIGKKRLDMPCERTILKDMKCTNCNAPIVFNYVMGSQGYWCHPDKADYGNHGTFCSDDDNDEARPQTKDIR